MPAASAASRAAVVADGTTGNSRPQPRPGVANLAGCERTYAPLNGGGDGLRASNSSAELDLGGLSGRTRIPASSSAAHAPGGMSITSFFLTTLIAPRCD